MADPKATVDKLLRDWLAWVEAGAPTNHKLFDRASGLCAALGNQTAARVACYVNLRSRFVRDGLDTAYPFGEKAFFQHFNGKTQHECPKRLAWVRKELQHSTT